MSVKYQKYHRKGKKVLAQFRPGKVTKARTFNLGNQKYTYLLHILFDGEVTEVKLMPQDVEEFSKDKL